MQVVLPTPHRKSHVRRTPTSLISIAKSGWRRPSSRDLIFAPLPLTRVLVAWLAIAIALRINEVIQLDVLAPSIGSAPAAVIGAMLSIVSVLAVTHPFFRPYAGQWPEVLAWYGFVLAAFTVAFETIFLRYVHHLYGYEILGRYNVFRGELWPFVVLTVALTPILWAHWSQS